CVIQRRVVTVLVLSCIFFFQAEDGIRDRNVTGVQTCALPISNAIGYDESYDIPLTPDEMTAWQNKDNADDENTYWDKCSSQLGKIGRASCRERGKIEVVNVPVKKSKGKGRTMRITRSRQ